MLLLEQILGFDGMYHAVHRPENCLPWKTVVTNLRTKKEHQKYKEVSEQELMSQYLYLFCIILFDVCTDIL